MANQSDAEFRMMFMLNNMDINQEGQLSSEDRLFMGSAPRYQTDQGQPNPFGGVRWEGGRPVYSAVGQTVREPVVDDIFSPQQHQHQQQCHLQQLSELQQQQQQAQMFQQQLHEQQQLYQQQQLHQQQLFQQQQDVLQQQQHEQLQHQQHQFQLESQQQQQQPPQYHHQQNM